MENLKDGLIATAGEFGECGIAKNAGSMYCRILSVFTYLAFHKWMDAIECALTHI